jgi:integrase/recombinase XerD
VKWRRETPMVPTGKKHPILPAIATIKRDLTALSSVLDYCVDEGWRDDNPVLAWLKPGGRRKSRLKERRDPIVLPEHAHIDMVVARAPGLLAGMIRAALKTGARLEELVNADRAHVDRERRQLTVIGKRNKLRVISLEDEAGDLGWEVIASLPVSLETKALFWYRRVAKRRATRGQQPAQRFRQLNFGRLVEAVARQAQKQDQDFRPFTFHHLRHRAAVDWLKSGRSIYTLQQRLGHSSIKTTEIYLACSARRSTCRTDGRRSSRSTTPAPSSSRCPPRCSSRRNGRPRSSTCCSRPSRPAAGRGSTWRASP